MSAAPPKARISRTRVALGLAIAGLLAVFSGGLLLITAGTAASTSTSADQSVDYTEWVNQGDPVVTHENVPPGPSTDTERWIPGGEPTKHVTLEAAPERWTDTGATQVTEENTPPLSSSADTRWVSDGSFVDEANSTQDTHYSLVGGSWKSDVAPAFPDPGLPFRWQASTGKEPHGDEATWVEGPGNRHYTGDPGNSNWFAFTAGVTDIDFRWKEQARTPAVDEVSHLDYRWQKQVRTAVTPPVVTPPVVTPPVVTPPVVEPPVVEPPEVAPAEEAEPTKGPQAAPEVLGEQASAPPQQNQVPTVVDAGYAGQPSGDDWGAALVVGGLLLLTSSGAVAATRRT